MDTYNQQNLVDEINLTRSLLDSLERQITAADKAYQDMSTTLAVIKERGSIAASETRISIGSGMFLKGNLDVSGNIIIPIEILVSLAAMEPLSFITASVVDMS